MKAQQSRLSRLLDRETRFAAEKMDCERTGGARPPGWRAREERGFVISLPASVFFRDEEESLSYEARSRGIIEAIGLDSGQWKILVVAHTDSRRSERHGVLVSQHWADTVRDYLVERGRSPDRVQAQGMGGAHLIADNRRGSRAKNQRVEIIIEYDGRQ
jgi:outer membrane protein OmpA-like peptidoglycan-associated protein